MKLKSYTITQGKDRAPARSFYKAIGFTDEDLKKPIIGIANTWIGTMPCNFLLRELAVKVAEGIRKAGGTPMEYNTIAISDGITMGTEGMKTSLVSREVIADSIELVARGHMFDGMVALVACDKTIPGAAMALLRLNIPSVVLYGGSILPGHYKGRDLTIQDVYEAVGANAAGKMSDEELLAIENSACPGAGACGGQFTANTMATVMEMIGLSPMGTAVGAASGSAQARCRGALRRADLERREAKPAAARYRDAQVHRQRHRLGGRYRRIHQRRAASAGHRARSRHPAEHRRFPNHQRTHAAARGSETRRQVRCRGCRQGRRYSGDRQAPGGRRLCGRFRHDRDRPHFRRRSGATPRKRRARK